MTAAEFVQHLASKRHPAALRASVMAHAASLSDDAVALYAATRYVRGVSDVTTAHLPGRAHCSSGVQSGRSCMAAW